MKYYFKYIGVLGVVLLAFIAFGLYLSSRHTATPATTNIVTRTQHLDHVTLSDQEQYTQIKGEYIALVKNQNPEVALELVSQRVETDQFLLNHCHALVHELGHTAYKKYKDLDLALQNQDGVCNSGYLHGVIEEYLANVTDVFAAIKTMCVNRDQGRCYHGMGHGLMYYTGNNLPESLTYCDKLNSGNPTAYCAQGVFMENFNTDLKLHPSEYLNANDASFPCAEQQEKFKRACYYYAPTFYVALHKKDFVATLAWCNTLDSKYIGMCSVGTGGLAIKFNISQPKTVESLCMSGIGIQVASCIDGMVGLYMNHFDSIAKGNELCAQLELQNQKICFNGVTSRSAIFMQ